MIITTINQTRYGDPTAPSYKVAKDLEQVINFDVILLHSIN